MIDNFSLSDLWVAQRIVEIQMDILSTTPDVSNAEEKRDLLNARLDRINKKIMELIEEL